MKKIILSVVATIFSLTAMGQDPQYYNSWMFNEVVTQGCISIPVSESDAFAHTCYTGPLVNVYAYAQPYFTDSIISIKGIAILGSWGTNPDTKNAFYFQIRDSSLNNILAQVRYDTIPFSFSPTPTWNFQNQFAEVLFDSSIFINANKFYTVMTLQEANSVAPDIFFPGVMTFGLLDKCTVTEYPKFFTNVQWEELIDFNTHQPPLGLALFPILDTLTYPQDTTLGLSKVNFDVEIDIYPNPAENELNVSSSVEITKIEILNLLGQIIFTKDIKSSNTKIDVSNITKGNYIAKTYTKKGVKTNKFVVK
ncbi:MAG: T9SS type A sorting domain-containing protein [Bacteroidales bacterium]